MIIGLSGYARSGKNTVADMLGLDYRQIAFGSEIKEALYTLNPVIRADYEEITLVELVDRHGWDYVKENYSETRRLLQRLGKEVGRDMFGKDFWVFQALKDVTYEDNIVFTDVRFPNEARAIVNDLGGQVWRINREGVSAVNAHSSETALDGWKFDRVIDNNGTLDELREKVKI